MAGFLTIITDENIDTFHLTLKTAFNNAFKKLYCLPLAVEARRFH